MRRPAVIATLLAGLATAPGAEPVAAGGNAAFPPPGWWRTDLAQVDACLATVRRGKVEELAQSPSGRPVFAVAYGPAPRPQGTSNLSGAMGCNEPQAYKDEGQPQSVILVAGCHGAEAEAVNGALNLIQALETGRDFAGIDRGKLVALAGRYRLVIIPVLNPDGRARSPASMLGVGPEEALRISQGTWKDGTPVGYPACKRYQPLDPAAVSFLGGYPNDAGYNLMHDATPGDIRTPEVAALLKLVERERADLVLHLHSHGTPGDILPPNHGMLDLQRKRILDYRRRLEALLVSRGLEATHIPERDPGATWLCPFNLASLTSLVSGALSPIYEQPTGTNPKHPRDYPTMLEESMVVFELFLDWGQRERFSPRKELFMTMLDASAEPATYFRETWLPKP